MLVVGRNDASCRLPDTRGQASRSVLEGYIDGARRGRVPRQPDLDREIQCVSKGPLGVSFNHTSMLVFIRAAPRSQQAMHLDFPRFKLPGTLAADLNAHRNHFEQEV